MSKFSFTRNIIRIGIFLTLAVVTLYLFPRYDKSFRYHIEVGKPWGYEMVTAEFDFPIYKSQNHLQDERREILKDFAPCYTYAENAQQTTPLVVSLQEMDKLQKAGYQQIAVIRNNVSTTYPITKIYTPKTAYLALGTEVIPNLQADTMTTRKLKADLLSSILPTCGIVQTGEKIIDKGEIVTEDDYQILLSLQRAMKENNLSKQQLWLGIMGKGIVVCLFLLMFVLYLFVFRRGFYDNLSTILFFCLLSSVIIALACITLRYTRLSIYLVPFAWVPIITRVFYDSRTALFLHLTTIFITALAVPSPAEFLIVQTAVGMVAVASMRDLTKRAQLAQTAFCIMLMYAAAYTGIVISEMGNMNSIDPYMYLYFACNGILVLCAYGLIYLFEKMFSLVSAITLVELTDINSSLLHELADKAPGTFQHSMQVSNLATEAAKKIGANVLLVRTGALYHDVGKLTHPEYFTENQQDGHNPLLEMSPQEASRIIIDHRNDGVHLAKRHHLPTSIINFIETHHGDSLVRYFYNTYVNAHPNETIDATPFRYPGPKPTTKEAAILMMSDAVEARSRSLKEFTEDSISEMVNSMIDQQIAEKQFIETPMSFKDIEDIKQVFINKLITIYHHRIKYPTLLSSQP